MHSFDEGHRQPPSLTKVVVAIKSVGRCTTSFVTLTARHGILPTIPNSRSKIFHRLAFPLRRVKAGCGFCRVVPNGFLQVQVIEVCHFSSRQILASSRNRRRYGANPSMAGRQGRICVDIQLNTLTTPNATAHRKSGETVHFAGPTNFVTAASSSIQS